MCRKYKLFVRGPAKGTHPLIHSTTKISKQNDHLCATKSQELGHINWFISPVDEKFSYGEKKKKRELWLEDTTENSQQNESEKGE